jgi:molybdenum cofactor cytidylyltransferase
MIDSSPSRGVAGVVLAAGRSQRLGRPKQTLPYGCGTLLDHALEVARACEFDQLLVTLGGNAAEVRRATDLSGAEVVEVTDAEPGCSSSIGAAVGAIDPRCQVLVLMLGDQPGVSPKTVRRLLGGRGDAAFAVCRYDDGRGHPLALDRSTFAEVRALHGDKAVWRLLERHPEQVVEVRVEGPTPPDVDTWADYVLVRAQAGSPA